MESSIINAILEDDFEWFVELVSNYGVNAKDINGFTPLMLCVQNGRIDMIDYLIEHNADVNQINNIGNTALFYAVFYSKNQTEIIEKLLKAGADINIQNKSGVSPLILANSMANDKVSKFLQNYSDCL